MSSSKRERHGCKERKDPKIDPELYDGYKFHKTYETIGDGHRHLWIRRNNAENPEWMTHVNGKRVLPGFTVNEHEPDIHLYKTLYGTTVRCSPGDVVYHHQIIKGGALYSGTPNCQRVHAMKRYSLRSGYKFDKAKNKWYWSRSSPTPSSCSPFLALHCSSPKKLLKVREFFF